MAVLGGGGGGLSEVPLHSSMNLRPVLAGQRLCAIIPQVEGQEIVLKIQCELSEIGLTRRAAVKVTN